MAALFSELSNPVTSNETLADKRALELALELTMLNFGGGGTNGGDPNIDFHHHHNHHHHQSSVDNLSSAFSALIGSGVEERTKKSQNMTECVPVPSSEHVAEIVGRQGKLHDTTWRSLC